MVFRTKVKKVAKMNKKKSTFEFAINNIFTNEFYYFIIFFQVEKFAIINERFATELKKKDR